MKRSNLLIPAIALLALATQAACDSFDSEAAEPPLPRPVKLVVVEGSTEDSSRSYPATIEAADRTELSFQVGGLIQELPVVEGDEVKEGTLIAQLDQRDYQNQVASAKAQFDNAEDEYQRALRLADTNAISQSQLEQRKSQRDIAEALVAGFKAETAMPLLRSRDYARAACYAKNVEMPQRYERAHLLYLQNYGEADRDFYPFFQGHGIDENTAILVSGDQFEVIGQSYVAIYDHGRMLDSGGYFYFLRPGDRFNLQSREAYRMVRSSQTFERVQRKSWPEE